jgi:hypothetical protein
VFNRDHRIKYLCNLAVEERTFNVTLEVRLERLKRDSATSSAVLKRSHFLENVN